MSLDGIAEEISAVAASHELLDEENLAARIEALDDLDFVGVVIGAHLHAHPADPEAKRLRVQAAELHRQLAAVNLRLFERYRAQIRARTIAPLDLRRIFDRYTGYVPMAAVKPASQPRSASQPHRHLGFEPLDRLVAGLLLREAAPAPREHESLEMVTYQPTPASVVLEMVDTLALDSDDVFYDVGSGLGQVVHLISLLTGVRSAGIEIDPRLCAYANAVARDLDLRGVTFVNADARNVDYGEGTVFYLFTPFTGSILADVLAKLRGEGERHRIRVCGYGPITPHLAGEPWLRSLNDHRRDEFRLAVFESKQKPQKPCEG